MIIVLFCFFNYPCRGFFRDGNENRVITIPSGPNTDDGILSNESDNDRESD